MLGWLETFQCILTLFFVKYWVAAAMQIFFCIILFHSIGLCVFFFLPIARYSFVCFGLCDVYVMCVYVSMLYVCVCYKYMYIYIVCVCISVLCVCVRCVCVMIWCAVCVCLLYVCDIGTHPPMHKQEIWEDILLYPALSLSALFFETEFLTNLGENLVSETFL